MMDPHLVHLAETMGLDLCGMNPPMTSNEFCDLYEAYVTKWDEFHDKEEAVRDVWTAFRLHRTERRDAAVTAAIQVGFAHGLKLHDIHAILGLQWKQFIGGFINSSRPSRLETELDEWGWKILEANIHNLAQYDALSYSNVRSVVRTLGSDCQGYSVSSLVKRFGYELQSTKYRRK